MTYFCDIRRNSFNNVMEFNSRLFVEGQEFTPTNFAPIALSYAPTNYQIGTAGGPAIGQLALARTYVRGGMGIWPQNGGAGLFDSTRIACGQDVFVGAVWSATQGRLYAAAGTNGLGLSTFDSNLRMTAQGTISISSAVTVNSAYPVHLFCPLSGGRWITFTCPSGMSTLGASVATQSSLTETGAAGTATSITGRMPCIPLIGDNQVIAVGVPWAGAANANSDVQVYAVNRATGAFTNTASAWLPYSALGNFSAHGVWPSNMVMESSTQGYFYYPLLTASALTVYIGTVTGLGSGGTPAINNYNAVGATLTAVGGGPLDTSALTNIPAIPSLPATANRMVRAFVTEVSGARHLHVYVFEPGTGSTVNPGSCQLYVWRLDSKTTATFVQRVDLSAGRLRALMSTDNTQTRVVAVYDDRLVFYAWSSLTEAWTLQSTQPLHTGDVGVDTAGRVWATTSIGTYRSTGVDKQELHLFETAGALANIEVSFDAATYTFTGLVIDANLVLNAFDTAGNRVAISVRLDRVSTNFSFAGNNASVVVSTSLSADTLVPISIFGTGQVTCRAAPTT